MSNPYDSDPARTPPPRFYGDAPGPDASPVSPDGPAERAGDPEHPAGAAQAREPHDPGRAGYAGYADRAGQPAPHAPPPAEGPRGPHDTAVLGAPLTAGPGQGPAGWPSSEPSGPDRPGRSSGRGRTAGVLLAASLLGGVTGLGGAAAYDLWLEEDPAPATSSASANAPVSDPGDAAAIGDVERVASAVLPSVVRIDVAGGGQAGSGSGIILTEDGQILTNEHVVGAAGAGGEITVSFADGSRAQAEVLGTDPLTDTAVIRASDVSGLTPATIGNSAALRVGQQVVAIGSPFGLDATVTSGIVSALDRPVNVSSDRDGQSTTYPAIQTDAAINPGNSGGPLVDLSGSVVGINSSIRTSSSFGQAGSIGLGFAIPITEVLPIVEQMANGEQPTHARMGVTVSDASQQEGQSTIGALVRGVSEGSSAAGAGIEEGDVITRVDDKLIDGQDDLVATVRSYRPGDEVEVTFVRDGEEQTVTMVLDSDGDD